MWSRHHLLLALCIVAGACLPQAKADVVAEFYRGRTVTLVVSSNAAGGYDTFARAVARYIGKHIPGNPTVIVRNMPGAGGMTATNFLYNNADKDGSVIGLVQNNTPFEPLFATKEARYDPVRFNWLGSPSAETAMVLLWHAVPVNSVAELKVREVAVGVSGANSTPAFFTRLLNATLGTKMKSINGYPGQNDVLLAMERREIDGHPSAFFSSVRSTRPNWLRDRIAKAIVQYGAQKLAELPDVPFAPDIVANDEDRLVMQAAFAPLALGRPFLVPPGVAAERVAALRAAFAATMADPDFLAEGERVELGLNAPRSGEQIQEVVERAYQSPSGVIDRLRQLNAP
ncbi:MAG: Bug family tripartite tricarboxylate transporter substrate binding protein [Xanthobacteraceae bacterium]